MLRQFLVATLTVLILSTAQTYASVNCNETGTRVEVLGSGEVSLDNRRSTGAYLVWHDDRARVLVNAGPGTYLRYKASGAVFSDLTAILITQSGLEQSADLPSLLMASLRQNRKEPLPIFGPGSNETYPSISEVIDRFAGEDGAYPELRSLFTYSSPAGYRIRLRDVQPTGRKIWAEFRTPELRLSAIGVHSGDIPSLAWRVDIGETGIVFANEFSNQRDVVASFAKGASALVVSHRLPPGTRGRSLEFYATPEEIARIAQSANVENLLLGSRGWRTFGRENATLETIDKVFDGAQLYATEDECWGF